MELPAATAFRFLSRCCSAVPPAEVAAGVAHPAACAAAPSPWPLALSAGALGLHSRPSSALAVGHPEQALPDVRRADARSRQIGGPDPISHRLQVSAYSGEPLTSKAARNLLSKDSCRPTLRDEAEELRPDVPLVLVSSPLSGARKGLAGATPSPGRPSWIPPGEKERVRPSPDPGEEMALRVPGEVLRFDILDPPLVHVAGGELSRVDQFPEPCGGLRVGVVVVGPSRPSGDAHGRSIQSGSVPEGSRISTPAS